MARQQIWFGEDMVSLHQKLSDEGLTSQGLADFVKDAFHDKIDDIRAKRLDLSKETIERLAFEAVQRETKKAVEKSMS
jgi:hypothetical protein